MGNNDLREMDQGHMDPSGRDLTAAGRILGIAATVLIIIPLVVVGFFVVVPIVARAFP
jgi:FtsH-binding integral membrane protein